MPVVLAGIVAGLRIQQTRRGRMAIITLDDGSAQVELTVFNEVFEANRPWIREDELLVVRGKADMDPCTANMRVNGEELFDLASARSHFAQQLALRCNGNASVAQLKKLFTPYHDGKCPVQIYYRNGDASCQLRLGAPQWWGGVLALDLITAIFGVMFAAVQGDEAVAGQFFHRKHRPAASGHRAECGQDRAITGENPSGNKNGSLSPRPGLSMNLD